MFLTDGEENLEVGVGLLEVHHPLVQASLSVFRLIVGLERRQFVLLEPSEREDDVGA